METEHKLGWPIVKLSRCAKFQEGYVNPPQGVAEYFGEDIKWLRAVDLNDSFVHETSRRLSTLGFKSAGKAAQLFRAGSLAISKSGTIGRLGILQDEMCGNRAVINIEPLEGIDRRFLFYSLIASRERIIQLADGSVQKNLYISQLGSVDLHMPPFREQRAISGVLGALDDKIEQNRQTAAALERLARSMFRAWFVDFEPVKAKASGAASFPSMPQDIFDALPTRLVASELGMLPEGWELGKLGDIAQEQRETVDPSEIDQTTPYIGLEHMPRRCIALTGWEHAGKVTSGKARFRAGQILFGKLRPYFHKVGIAPIDGVCSTDIVVVQPKTPRLFGLTLGHVSSDDFVAHTSSCSTGTKMPRTNWRDMSRYAIAVPPELASAAFNDLMSAMSNLIVSGIFESRKLAEMRDYLLPKLLSGGVHVGVNNA